MRAHVQSVLGWKSWLLLQGKEDSKVKVKIMKIFVWTYTRNIIFSCDLLKNSHKVFSVVCHMMITCGGFFQQPF